MQKWILIAIISSIVVITPASYLYQFLHKQVSSSEFKSFTENKISQLLRSSVKIGKIQFRFLKQISLSGLRIEQQGSHDPILIDVKKIVKHRKKVIIYGDAEMSYSEFEGDGWPPSGNEERVRQFSMGGDECLSFIKKRADSVVWINPVFKKEWEERDDSGTIHAAKAIVPMHDLTVGGVEDAIKELMK